jgi:hypothetical protein
LSRKIESILACDSAYLQTCLHGVKVSDVCAPPFAQESGRAMDRVRVCTSSSNTQMDAFQNGAFNAGGDDVHPKGEELMIVVCAATSRAANTYHAHILLFHTGSLRTARAYNIRLRMHVAMPTADSSGCSSASRRKRVLLSNIALFWCIPSQALTRRMLRCSPKAPKSMRGARYRAI